MRVIIVAILEYSKRVSMTRWSLTQNLKKGKECTISISNWRAFREEEPVGAKVWRQWSNYCAKNSEKVRVADSYREERSERLPEWVTLGAIDQTPGQGKVFEFQNYYSLLMRFKEAFTCPKLSVIYTPYCCGLLVLGITQKIKIIW